MSSTSPILADYADGPAPRMEPVDDVVMGGRSRSRFRTTADGTAVFEGLVSLANGGGFASVRGGLDNTDCSGCVGVRMRMRGDGRRYRLTLRNDRRLSGVNHQHAFDTEANAWTEVTLPFTDFVPRFRGRTPDDAPALDPGRIRQMGLMIADGKEGPFRLEIAWIRGWDGSSA